MTVGISLRTYVSALFDSFIGGHSKFELVKFGADNCSGIGMPHGGKKFDMVVRQMKT